MSCCFDAAPQHAAGRLRTRSSSVAASSTLTWNPPALHCRRPAWAAASSGAGCTTRHALGSSDSCSSAARAAAAAVPAGTTPLFMQVLTPQRTQQQQQQQHEQPPSPLSPPPPCLVQQQQQHVVALHTAQQGGAVWQRPAHSSNGAAVPGPAAITRSIKRCSCWQQVALLVRQRGAAFNIIHISAAMTHLAQLSSQQPVQQQLQAVQQQQHEGQQVPGLAAVTQQMQHQHAQLHAALVQQQQQQQPLVVAGDRLAPPPAPQQHLLLRQLLHRAAPRLHEASSRQAANMLWALAHLAFPWRDCERDAAAVTALADRAAALFSAAEAQHLSSTGYAAARLQLPVRAEWVSGLQAAWLRCVEQASTAQPGAVAAGSGSAEQAPAAVSSQAAANLLWALVQLQQAPGAAWLARLVGGLAPQLPGWPARHVAAFMWGCGRLGYRLAPGATGMQQSEQQQERPPEQQQMEQQQQQQQQRLFVMALQQHTGAFTAQDLTQVLWAAAAMGVQLPSALLHQLLAAMAQQLGMQQHGGLAQHPNGSSSSSSSVQGPVSRALAAHSVSVVLWSLTRLCGAPRQHLPPQLLRPLLVALHSSAPAACWQSLATAAGALCQLQLVSRCPLVMHGLLQAATQQAAAHGSSSSSDGVGGRPGSSAVAPGRAVATLLWAAAHCRADSSAGDGLCFDRERLRQRQQERLRLMLQGMQGLAAGPSSPVTAAAAASEARGMEGSTATAIRAAAHALVLRVADASVQQQQQQQVLPAASLRDLAQLLWAVERLQLQLPPAWWQCCLQQLQSLLGEPRAQHSAAADGQALALAVWALGKRRVLVAPPQMVQLQHASMQLLQAPQPQRPSAQSHVMLLVGFARLCGTAAHQQQPAQQLSHRRRQRCQQQQQQQQQRRSSVHVQASGAACTPAAQHAVTAPAGSAALTQQQQRHRWVTAAGLTPAWLHACCASVAPQVAALPPTGLVGLLWALAKLQFHPGSAFMCDALARVAQLLPCMGPRHIALLLWSLVRLQQLPDARLLAALESAWEARLASANKADNQQVLWVQQQLAVLQQDGCVQQ